MERSDISKSHCLSFSTESQPFNLENLHIYKRETALKESEVKAKKANYEKYSNKLISQLIKTHVPKLKVISKSIYNAEFKFINKKVESQFNHLLENKNDKNHNKINTLIEDVKRQPWSLMGEGQPEKLKNPFKGYKGCISRRINGRDRLVYKVEGSSIFVLACEGHYD